MAFQLSPGVLVVEKDLTGIVPAVATSIGGFVGAFEWGPVNEITTLSNEAELVRLFGKPNDVNAQYWFSAANFLSYSNNLKVIRVIGDATNANADGEVDIVIENETDWENNWATGSNAGGAFAAKFPGPLGNSLKVSMCDSFGWNMNVGLRLPKTVTFQDSPNTVTVSAHGLANGDVISFTEINSTTGISVNTPYYVINATLNTFQLSLTSGGTGIDLTTDGTGTLGTQWAYRNEFDGAPGTSAYFENLGNASANDEIHVVVIDEDGLWTGERGSILEKFSFLSKAEGARKSDGTAAHYVQALRGSKYIHWLNHWDNSSNWDSTNWTTETLSTVVFDTVDSVGFADWSLSGAQTDMTVPLEGKFLNAWDMFANAEIVDVNLLINGPSPLSTVGQYIVNLAASRMDCVAFVSPNQSSVVNNPGDEAVDVIADRNSLNISSSYGVMDSGWKYQYDKYNDKYRWVPLNADIAGLCARTDDIADPWFSPGGLNRGQIKNVVKLAFSPGKTDRDELYKSGVNPVVTFLGEGTVLFGDKTLLAKPSAFDRINVRRLFIVLEKAIATAGKYQLFEFNDAFTRAQFRSLVEPFLRDVKGRRGIFDFRVVCDETNNTGEVIDRNEFVADIYIKPARSINFMKLNFIATRTGVSFEEVVGA
jgi:hypothetical protein